MSATYAERHIRALKLAKKCAALGARSRTIEFVTGLAHSEVTRLFFSDRRAPTQGRAPDSPDWYHSANLINRAEASIFVSVYRRIRDLGFGPDEALVGGYKHYMACCPGSPRINFDRAFDLACHIDGLWTVRVPNFTLLTCPTCTSQYVASPGARPVTNHDCPFCKLIKRYPRDARLQTSFPVKPIPDFSVMEFGVIALSKRMSA